MDVVTTLVIGILLALFTGIQAWLTKERFDKQDQRMDRTDERVDRRFDQVAAELAAIRAQMAAENAAIRSDLTQIALALGLRARPETG